MTSLLGLFASALLSPGLSVPSAASAAPSIALPSAAWSFNGDAADACALNSAGHATDDVGVTLEVQCEPGAKILGNALSKLPAAAVQQRRITITAEVRADAGMNTSLWLKTSHDNATLLFENDAEQSLTSAVDAEGWSQRSISLPVSSTATGVSYGVLLQGGGTTAVRNLKVTVSQDGAMSPAAQAVLEAALTIVKQHAAARSDIAWRVLETDVRVFASGAQYSAEVYPAIKYLLAQLGDKRSLLLTPELANVFARSGRESNGTAKIQIFTLPDGADLVLSATNADRDARLARNWADASAAPP